jgi:hypothetical protein
MKRLLLVAFALVLSECTGCRSDREYVVVSAKHYTERFEGANRDSIRYTIRHPAPSSCRKEPTVFPLKNKTTEPENSMHVGTNTTSPL